MAGKLKLKRNLAATEITAYTPEEGELIFDTHRWQLRVGDGVTAGGVLPKELVCTPVQSTSTAYAAQPGDVVLADVRANNVTINLPTNASNGDIVRIMDVYYAADETHYITVVPGTGQKINNAAENFVIDVPRSYMTFIYVDTTKNWAVDLGGLVVPKYEIAITDELEWTAAGALGIDHVSGSKVTEGIDFEAF
jgi:hypothetical protein